jgi:hypothetical protein
MFCLALSATNALAQGDGVTVDPDSPTAKQYKLPIESAREQANPKGDGELVPPGAPPAGASAAPLFGEGIVQVGSRGGRTKGSSTTGSKPSTTKGSSVTSEQNAAPLKAAVQNPGAPAGGAGAALLIAGGGALVLLIGTLLGLALRRRRTD